MNSAVGHNPHFFLDFWSWRGKKNQWLSSKKLEIFPYFLTSFTNIVISDPLRWKLNNLKKSRNFKNQVQSDEHDEVNDDVIETETAE